MIWLYDMNIGGSLNMTPKAREAHMKKCTETEVLIQSDGDGVDSDAYSRNEGSSNSDRNRSKYLKRVGVDAGNTSDCEPLLQ